MERDDTRPPAKGDRYRHPEGINEVVYAVDGEVVLTIREYRRRSDFERAVEEADYVGIDEDVASLPDVETFEDPDG